MAMLVFASCMIIGGLQADNPFATTVLRALGGMIITFIVALVVGAMATKMLDENIAQLEEKSEKSAATVASDDR